MKYTTVIAFAAALIFALSARPAAASPSGKAAGFHAPTTAAVAFAKDDIKAEKDKPKKTKKNPNDGKDGDPDDGNAGGGNDGRTLPNDGPAND